MRVAFSYLFSRSTATRCTLKFCSRPKKLWTKNLIGSLNPSGSLTTTLKKNVKNWKISTMNSSSVRENYPNLRSLNERQKKFDEEDSKVKLWQAQATDIIPL